MANNKNNTNNKHSASLGIFSTIGVVVVIAALFYWLVMQEHEEMEPEAPGMIQYQNREDYKKNMLGRLDYKEVYLEQNIENLTMIGNISRYGVTGKNKNERLYGMILRCMRYQNITRRVERRYGLPKNLIMSMIMQETGGVDLLPNAGDDGGLGLCHMQPSVAAEFGLRTYKNCRELICQEHAKEIRQLIDDSKRDRKTLMIYDDRFNPVLNIDAVGRILCYHRDGPQRKRTPIQTAIVGYSGSVNYAKYYENLLYFQSQLADPDVIEAVEREFNTLNPNLTIGGKPADYDAFIKYHQEQNLNYGLDKL